MIIKANGEYIKHSLFLNTNFSDEEAYIIDETTEEGQQMAELYMNNYPLVDFEVDEDNFVTSVSVIPLEKPQEVEGKEIQLVKNDQGEWEYIYVDIPKTEVEIQQEIINVLGQELVQLKLQFIMGGM